MIFAPPRPSQGAGPMRLAGRAGPTAAYVWLATHAQEELRD